MHKTLPLVHFKEVLALLWYFAHIDLCTSASVISRLSLHDVRGNHDMMERTGHAVNLYQAVMFIGFESVAFK